MPEYQQRYGEVEGLPQNNEWKWINGNDATNIPGVYGDKEIYSSKNDPGSRSDHSTLIDTENQNIYLFGGYGFSSSGSAGYLNDLWSYNYMSSGPIPNDNDSSHDKDSSSKCIIEMPIFLVSILFGTTFFVSW